jgi:3-phenylpropionate/cinnamic acid dioxygenase small subunit
VAEGAFEVLKVRVGDPAYSDVVEFLYTEAALLDDNRFEDWLDLLTDDISYRAPVRSTVAKGDGTGFADQTCYLDDDRSSLGVRVKRTTSPNDWAEEPPSRTRRFVTNVMVEQAGEELRAVSSLLLLRSRWDLHRPELISAKRHDLLRRADGGMKLARREIFVDQTNLDSPNLGIFL